MINVGFIVFLQLIVRKIYIKLCNMVNKNNDLQLRSFKQYYKIVKGSKKILENMIMKS